MISNTRRQWILLAAFLLLAGVYIWGYTGWGRHPAIQISHSAYKNPRQSARLARATDRPKPTVMRFNLDHAYRLTEIKVVRLADWQTNKTTLPLWHLISDSNSLPTMRFSYGAPLRGMKPAASVFRPEPLEPEVPYRLFLTDGRVQGQHDFLMPADRTMKKEE